MIESTMARSRRFAARFLFAVCAVFASLPAHALVVDYGSLGFASDDQSMWDTGNAAIFDESIFVGTTWNSPTATIGTFVGGEVTTPAVPPIQITPAIPRTLLTPAIPSKTIIPAKRVCVPFVGCATTPAVKTPYIPAVYSPAIPAVYTPAIPAVTFDTTSGAQAQAQTSGKVGLEFSLAADAGSVDADVAFSNAQLVVPDSINPLEFFSLEGTSTAGTQTFETTFPNLSAKAELVIDINATLGGEVCVVGECADGSVNLGTSGEVRQELISLNEGGNGIIRLLGDDNLTPAGFNFGDPIDIVGGFGSATVYLPDLTTTGVLDGETLKASGETDVLRLDADLDRIATTLMGLPPLGESLDVGIFSASYDLLSLTFGPILEIMQDFEVDVTLMADLEFSAPVFVEGDSQRVDFLSVPFNDIPRLALDFNQEVVVTPEFWLDANLRNATSLGVDAEFVFKALEANIALSALGANYNLGGVGPLFEFRKRFGVADLPPLFDSQFTLDGFNRVAGQTFSLSTLPPGPGAGGGTGGNTGGTGAADAPELKNAGAVLITGSPVTLSQRVGEPATDTFTFSFDYQFVENGDLSSADVPTLDVFLADQLIVSLAWTDAMPDFDTFTTTLTTADFDWGLDPTLLDTALLEFIFDGPAGSILLLDNIVFPDIVNGDFNLASLTGGLTGWSGEASTPAGFVGAVVFESVPVPGTLLLLIAPLLLIGRLRLRRSGAVA
jgi:hypothetical protein